jgi:hypothetical protein
METNNWRRNLDATICVLAAAASNSNDAACERAAFDGVNRDDYFQGRLVSVRQPGGHPALEPDG